VTPNAPAIASLPVHEIWRTKRTSGGWALLIGRETGCPLVRRLPDRGLLFAITLRRPSRASVWLRAAAPAPASTRTGGRPIGSP
jgi:hypothetical protein